MNKLKVFISSVQSEFASERQMLYDYLTSDALLGRFFEPFIFEVLPAVDISTSKAYLKRVEYCDIYIGIFGKEYGSENKPVFRLPSWNMTMHQNHKTRLIFIPNHQEK